MRNWVISLLLLLPTGAGATPPQAALDDPLFARGYLVCDHYANVESDGTGDNTVGTNDLNTCIADSYGNQTAATLNTCGGVYVVTNSVVAYEWVTWNPATNSPRGGPQPAHTLRGREGAGCTRPTIKVKTCSPNFTNTGAPRPVVAFRSFQAANANAEEGLKPGHPLGLPANHNDGGGIFFQEVFHNIDIDTSECAGAIGLTQLAGQNSMITNTKITATGSYAGLFGPPGRSGLVGNVEVIGGSYGVIIGSYPNLGNINPQQGTNFAGFRASGQTIASMRLSDPVPPVLSGFIISKSSDGPAILSEGYGIALIDGSITMTGAAVNDVVVDNTIGRNMYARSVYVSGSNQIFKSGPQISGPTSAGTWARVVEYAATDQYSVDGSSNPATFPAITERCGSPPKPPCHWEGRSLIYENNAWVLAGHRVPLEQITSNSELPPSDLLSRHIWATLPSIWDTPQCVFPSAYGAQLVLGSNYNDIMVQSYDSAADIEEAIAAAAAAGHNRVCLERGSYVIGSTITSAANTQFIGAGPRKSAILTKSTWNPTTAVPMIETVDSAASTVHMNFFTLYHKTTPFANDFIHSLRWRSGKNSSALMVDLSAQFLCECGGGCTATNKQRYAMWFSGNGGGRFWMTQQNLPTSVDRHLDSRLIFLDGNTQPASFYGNNLEAGKASSCGTPYANMEVKNNTAGVRSYSTKREGSASTLYINNSSNVGMFGMGAMAAGANAAAGAYNQITSTSDSYVIAPTTVRDNQNTSSRPIVKILPSTDYIPWPNAPSVVKKGTLDDAPFGAVAATAPDLSTVIVDTANQVDVKFNVYDGAALLPATGASGLTFTVDGTSKTPTGAVVRVGNDTYRATFAASTITSGAQEVRVTYVPGNITAGGAGTPAAQAFTNVLASNTLPPGTNPVFTQTGYMLRQLSGDMALTVQGSPPYQSTQGVYENAPGRFLVNSEFRLHLQASVNNADAPTQALSICWEHNESGTFALLTNDCSVNKTCFTDAPDLADGAPTIQQLTPTEATFVPGGLLKNAATQVNVTLPQNSETVYEAAIRLSGATVGHRYRYRLCKAGGAPLDSYPEANVALVTAISQRSEGNGGMQK